MAINRRRAPSTEISREKKLGGHQREDDYALLIGGKVIKGVQKGDVEDQNEELHSVKSGKKWQVFLYGYNRISSSKHLNILLPCLDAFPIDSSQYFKDREKCIAFKENYVQNYGKEATKSLSNHDVAKKVGANSYIDSKNKLNNSTILVSTKLKNKIDLRNFLQEALFNNNDVQFLVVKDTTYIKDELFKVFSKKDVLDILSKNLFPSTSIAGRVPEDYNVAGQKTLLCYKNTKGVSKNIVEIEIRNDSSTHFRQVRFNMYSKDTLFLLLNNNMPSKSYKQNVLIYGEAIEKFIV